MSTEPPIVTTPRDLTPDWLTAALRADGRLDGAAVVGVAATPIGTGQMCDCLRLILDFDGPTSAPASVIAKIPSADPETRATAMRLRSYETEVRFYQRLAPALPVRTPATYFAEIDTATGAFAVLLEDLAPARQGDQLAGCTPEVAAIAVDEAVKLHAPRWGDATLGELDWLTRDPEAHRQMKLRVLPDLWAGFRNRYGTELGPEVHRAGEALIDRLESYLGEDTRPWSIVHGDYRLDNLLFDPSPGGIGVAVVDWQTCTYGPALQDVAYFLGAGLTPGERRATERDLVRRYHTGLLTYGVTDYDWERCWHDYRRGTWLGLVMTLAASMLVERTDRGDQMFLTMASRHATHITDLDAVATIG